jgi:hypothetical protein
MTNIELTDYQWDVLESRSPRRAFVGARQTGKTEVCLKEVEGTVSAGREALCVLPQQRMVNEFEDRLSDRCGRYNVETLSSWTIGSRDPTRLTDMTHVDPDVIVVDEAEYIEPSVLGLVLDTETDVLLSGTPNYTDPGLFTKCARWDHVETVHANMYDAPFIDPDRIQDLKSDMTLAQEVSEVYALYQK